MARSSGRLSHRDSRATLVRDNNRCTRRFERHNRHPATMCLRLSPKRPRLSDEDHRGALSALRARGCSPFILLSFGAAFLALLTPCVFPMVPITVSFFAKRREKSNVHGVRDALAYCAGIVCTFTGLGLIMTLLFGATGIQKLATNPIVNVGLAVLFLVLAANLLGVFEIIVPTKLTNAAQSGTSKGGLFGPLLMGLTFTLTSFTCTVAFVGTLLAAAAKGSIFFPVVGMLAFSTAFASPFFLLALFPQYLAKLPRAGSWMVSVKAFMGFLEIAAAMKFLSNADLVWSWGILTRPVFLAIWAMIGVIAGLYLLGGLRLPHDSSTKYGWPRRFLGGATVVAGFYCLLAIESAPLGAINAFLPAFELSRSRGPEASPENLPFLTDYQAALAQAKAENKLVFVDFTGWTCSTCRQVEDGIFPQPDVSRELKKMVRVKLYTDNGTPEDNRNKDLEQKTGRPPSGLPESYVVVSPGRTGVAYQKGSLFTRRSSSPPSSALAAPTPPPAADLIALWREAARTQLRSLAGTFWQFECQNRLCFSVFYFIARRLSQGVFYKQKRSTTWHAS